MYDFITSIGSIVPSLLKDKLKSISNIYKDFNNSIIL